MSFECLTLSTPQKGVIQQCTFELESFYWSCTGQETADDDRRDRSQYQSVDLIYFALP